MPRATITFDDGTVGYINVLSFHTETSVAEVVPGSFGLSRLRGVRTQITLEGIVDLTERLDSRVAATNAAFSVPAAIVVWCAVCGTTARNETNTRFDCSCSSREPLVQTEMTIKAPAKPPKTRYEMIREGQL